MPISGCHDLPLATFNLPLPQQPSKQTATTPPVVIPDMENIQNLRRKAGLPWGDFFTNRERPHAGDAL